MADKGAAQGQPTVEELEKKIATLEEQLKEQAGVQEDDLKITAAQLKGLKYNSAVRKKVKEDGKEVVKTSLIERQLTVKDVLAARQDGDEIVIATADGRKHRIPAK
ncbi:hypothetical protein HTZ97_16335 [Desulfuromonas acetoxidans]|uniref:Uncharacterized protein n=1 Tax=Desulfuromonas acetoxidans (strain DSM 684 / 11070) TaxID=281689 RepID=Q1K070_DESA6|nr:hypothetical protein [Desulfuromonas acetoxidans]EAT16071.1 hypothetical protein Dace_2372 [Desulfuromonas acetoxidans DSM 684]MBF0646886.1 hypothetical protein [Desulfuromonas acetoxidans]NVD26163.1 hypothetical protein [Desulfuromonas acetoxidans]NVE18025.1 hypothetical protein [Desulfuromonas acetoxidans]